MRRNPTSRDRSRMRGMMLPAAVALLALAPGAGAHAQPPEGPPLTVHGFLSQGYARAWDYGIAGIPTAGTLDYRAIALQIAYRFTDADRIVIQFNHRGLGDSPLEPGTDAVRLDWGFYERDIAGGSARIGKVPLPRGLFNEVRDVGTALPFYRAPVLFYMEAGETLDGVVLGHRFFADRSWSVQTEAFGGAYDLDYIAWQQDGSSAVEAVEARSVHGAQLWLETPVTGLRLGLGGMRFRQQGDSAGRFFSTWVGSAEQIIDRVTARAEYSRATSAGYDFEVGYAHMGIRLGGGVSANVQTEFANIAVHTPFGQFDVDYGRDHVVGLKWMVRPTAALKIEGHRFRGYAVDGYMPLQGPPASGEYAIVSIAVGF